MSSSPKKNDTLQEPVRLNRYLASCGLCSRRTADEWISAGKVRINGKLATELGAKVTPGVDKVVANGKQAKMADDRVVLLLNKPKGVICTASDPKKRKTVVDMIELDRRVVPVGRLDADSTGALIMTDDGDLLNLLTHPRHHVEKEYMVLTDGELTEKDLERFARGIRLDRKKTLPCKIERVGRSTARPRYIITLREGRNRQIRRMMATLGFKVQMLKRRRVGSLGLGKLESGEWRFLSKKEVDQLRESTQASKVDKPA